ncbi:MAG: PAC2 family protein, partial [Myxococcota bacterium]|nr:PAC2 family protein [Myxococcota bacterium]
MGDALRFHVRPSLADPALLLAFDGWNDACEAASTAASFVADAFQAVTLAEIEGEDFYDFTVRRPAVRGGPGEPRRIEWPSYRFRYAEAAGRGVVVGEGGEPHLRWRAFTREVVALVRACGVRRVVLLGADLADVLYSLPVAVRGTAPAGQAEVLGLAPSAYEGPTGIVGVLGERLREEGLEVTSLWAGLPHYISLTPNPRGALALAERAARVLGVEADLEPLRDAAA